MIDHFAVGDAQSVRNFVGFGKETMNIFVSQTYLGGRNVQTWKVLIADDEPIIREGIREAINWEEFQMEVIAEAEDGEEALELAVRHSVHVLFVDLNMPIMDGITLMKQIRKKLPKCRIVVVTGHDEFTYAQEAIRLQVEDYILKPTNPLHLREVVKKIKQQLEGELQQNEYVQLLSKQVQKKFFAHTATVLFRVDQWRNERKRNHYSVAIFQTSSILSGSISDHSLERVFQYQ